MTHAIRISMGKAVWAAFALGASCGGGGASVTRTSAGTEEMLAEARGLHFAGDYDGAIALLEPLVEREPEHAEAWLAYGSSLHAKGDVEAALAAHETAAGFESTELRARYNIARAQARLGSVEKAFDGLNELKNTGAFNLTGIDLEADFESLRSDPRYRALLPTPEELAEPFVEPTVVVREWRGEGAGDAFGWIARNIGDVDGDGVNDVTTSAPNKDIGGANAGWVYAYSGRSGTLLWSRSGEAGNYLGVGVEAAGDVNADGVPDVVAGAPGEGRTYVFSGRDGAAVLTLSESQEGESFGRKVSGAGDVDGDGHDDVLAGAPGNDARGEDAGRAAVYSGKDGSPLVEWFGEEAGDRFGSSGDGRSGSFGSVFVVGAPDAGDGDRGASYVYEGIDEAPAFVIGSGADDRELGGMFVSFVGDVDADGRPDVYASDWSSGAAGRGAGRIYVHSGKTGQRLLVIDGEAPGDGFGIGRADAGDVDGDGHDDLIIGAWQHGGAAPSGGKVYLFSGRDGSLVRAWTGKVPGETFGFDATGLGDVNGDGAVDFLLTSAWSAVNGSRSGRMYVISGAER